MVRRPITFLVATLVAAQPLYAQSPQTNIDWTAALGSTAVSLARHIDLAKERVRIGVMPVRSTGAPLDQKTSLQMTDGLAGAIVAAIRPANRPIEIVEGPDLNKYLVEQGLSGASPFDVRDAVRAGSLVAADYVVFGTVNRSRMLTWSNARLDLEVVDVKASKSVGSSTVTLSLETTADGNVKQRAGVVEPKKPADGWTPRKMALTSGISVALAAGGMALYKELQLRSSVRQMNALPPEATNQWQALLDRASLQIKARNFWQSMAIGVGGVTVGYMLTSRSHAISAAPILVPVGKHWSTGVDPARRALSLVRSF